MLGVDRGREEGRGGVRKGLSTKGMDQFRHEYATPPTPKCGLVSPHEWTTGGLM